MKSFWLSIIAMVMFSGVAFAGPVATVCPGSGDYQQACAPEEDPELAPPVTIEALEEAVAATFAVTRKYTDDMAETIIYVTASNAQAIMMSFQYAIADLLSQGVDVTKLQDLFEEADRRFQVAGQSFNKGSTYASLGSVLAGEADDADGLEALTLRLKAASCYSTAATYIKVCEAELANVLDIGEEARLLFEKLSPEIVVPEPVEPEVDDTSGRYHIRTRTGDFFRRSRKV